MIIDGYERRIVRLEREVAEVREQLRRNSQNSSKPPSSDGPHVKRKPPKEPSGRKPGGQPGHPVHRRTLIPVEQVSEVVACLPTHCRRCGQQGKRTEAHKLLLDVYNWFTEGFDTKDLQEARTLLEALAAGSS